MKKICGIYIIKNKINDLVYIGQSVDIKARWYAHCASGKNAQKQDSYTQLHTAMRKLGINNFYYEILEQCSIDELNKKEQYYIQAYNSYQHGYNMTLGGEGNKYETNGRALLTLEQVQEIRLMYNARIPFKKAYERYANIISKRGFKKVWLYETWLGVYPEVYTDENRKWHATMAKRFADGNKKYGFNNVERKSSEEEIQRMRELRATGMSYEKIGKEVKRSTSVVRKYCLHNEAIKPHADGSKQPSAIKVRNIETGLIFNSIKEAGRWAGLSDEKRISQIIHGKIPSNSTSGTVPTTNQRCHWEKV